MVERVTYSDESWRAVGIDEGCTSNGHAEKMPWQQQQPTSRVAAVRLATAE
jgi:hypothetical protein